MKTTDTLDIENPKVKQILKGAQDAFLELGYEGASTDEIVRRAGVSKGTLYNYFPDKQTLFTVFIEGECRKQATLVFKLEGQPAEIEAVLRESAQNFVKMLLSPFMQGI
ncbi:MAG: TetR/AcrR family transcriptional regulator [Thermosynechococcaceae cyanobacterium]